MRKVYTNPPEENSIVKFSFYAPAEGYIAFENNIGFTSDSGRTVAMKPLSNIDSNGYTAAVAGKVVINGVKAFNKDTILVYGNVFNVEKEDRQQFILFSATQGNSYKLVFLSPALKEESFRMDMAFEQNNNTGFVAYDSVILKTTNRGLNWDTSLHNPVYVGFQRLKVVSSDAVYAFYYQHLIKTIDGGNNWQQVLLPTDTVSNKTFSPIFCGDFISQNKGWLSTYVNFEDASTKYYIYYTSTGGDNWTIMNEAFKGYYGMTFINDSTGFIIASNRDDILDDIYRTTDSGKIWEPLPKNYPVFETGNQDFYGIQVINDNQLWVGAGNGLAINTNISGPTLPRVNFIVDTANITLTNTVKLQNKSNRFHSFKWFVNNSLISTNYNTSYSRSTRAAATDTIMLVAHNEISADTLIRIQAFTVPSITSFTPAAATTGQVVTISGTNFSGAISVSFGGVPADSFKVISPTTINAYTGAGASGAVSVSTAMGFTSKAGFTFIPPATITSFYPAIVGPGDTLTITGTNFITNNCSAATDFGGVLEVKSITETLMVCLVAAGEQGYKGNGITVYDGLTNIQLRAMDTITFDATPVIYSVTPLTASAGTVVSITGKYLAPGAGGEPVVTFGGATSGLVTVISNYAITAVVGNGASGNVAVKNYYAVTGIYPGFMYRSSICPNGNTSFTAHLSGTNYQWQLNTGSGFNNITGNANYTGTNTQILSLTNIPSAWAGYQYRCVVNGVNTGVYNIGFANSWTNTGTAEWENTSGWSCGILPDGNTDVIINSGVVTVNSNAVCRSITVKPGAAVNVSAGATLTVTQ